MEQEEPAALGLRPAIRPAGTESRAEIPVSEVTHKRSVEDSGQVDRLEVVQEGAGEQVRFPPAETHPVPPAEPLEILGAASDRQAPWEDLRDIPAPDQEQELASQEPLVLDLDQL